MKKTLARIFGGSWTETDSDGELTYTYQYWVPGYLPNLWQRFVNGFIKTDCAIFICNIQILYYKIKIKLKK